MTADAPVDDERLTVLLSACDDALAIGTFPIVTGDMPSADLRPRVERGVAFLVRLQQLRRSPLAVTPARPTTIDRFVIRRELGRGGFGIVYLAFDPRLGREVALKVPHAGAMTDLDSRRRFRAEAQAAAGLDHPNLVPVYEAGEIDDICYLVSDYCPGGTLAAWLGRHRELIAPDAAAALIETLAGAVQYAHDHGVLHRDLKPANVLIAAGSRRQTADSNDKGNESPLHAAGCLPPAVKVADFGLAKRLKAEGPETRTGIFVGTPSYMAPEQAVAYAAVGPATDVYALGAILYECLTGRPPFQGDSALDTLEQVRSVDPIPPRRLRPKLPRDLETICLKCLEKEPSRRYAKAGQLANDLDRFRAGQPVTARRIGLTGRAWRWSKRWPVVAALAAALMVAVLGGGAAVVWQWRRAEFNAVAFRDQRDRAEREKQRAEANFRRAGVAVHAMSRAGDNLFHHAATKRRGERSSRRPPPSTRGLSPTRETTPRSFWKRPVAGRPRP